jgi:hypothetical protein
MPIWARTSLRRHGREGGAVGTGPNSRGEHRVDDQGGEDDTHEDQRQGGPVECVDVFVDTRPSEDRGGHPDAEQPAGQAVEGRSPAGHGMRGDPDQHRDDNDGHHLERRVVRDVSGDPCEQDVSKCSGGADRRRVPATRQGDAHQLAERDERAKGDCKASVDEPPGRSGRHHGDDREQCCRGDHHEVSHGAGVVQPAPDRRHDCSSTSELVGSSWSYAR